MYSMEELTLTPCNLFSIGSNIAKYWAIIFKLIKKLIFDVAAESWNARFLVILFTSALVDNLSRTVLISMKLLLNILIYFYFSDHRVSQNKGMFGISLLLNILSLKNSITSLTVPIVFLISGIEFWSFTTKLSICDAKLSKCENNLQLDIFF